MQRREQESEHYQVQAAAFKQDETKGIQQQPVRHFLSQRHLKKSPSICPQTKC